MGIYYAGQGSRSYWRERLYDKMHSLQKAEDKVLRDINKAYNRAFNEINRELNDFFVQYASDNHITLQQAQQRLTPIEDREYRQRIEQLKRAYEATRDENILSEIAQLSSRKEVTRFQALLDSISAKLIEVSDNVQITLDDYLNGAYTRGYNDSLENMQINKTVINHRSVEEVIRYPYAGAMFSDRIWRNKRQLLNWINDDLTKGIIRGDSIQKMGKSLRDRCHVAKYQAERLVRTESCYAYTQGSLHGYEDSKLVNAVEIMIAGDQRTCPTCIDKEGEVIPLSETRPGDNIPPFHPRQIVDVVSHR
nr:MAG TPA: minor capsid protein [Caudoviricetes sp.]